MAKKFIIFLAVIAIALAIGWYWYNKPRQGVKGRLTDVKITATELYNFYNTDEQEADKKFLKAIIEVKGIVSDIQINGDDGIVILNAQPGGGGTSCRFSPAAALQSGKIKTGMEVVIKGRCAGFNMDVNLTDCEIIL